MPEALAPIDLGPQREQTPEELEEIAALEARMREPPKQVRPRVGNDLRQRFVDQLKAVAGTTESVADWPLVGERISETWSGASKNLAATIAARSRGFDDAALIGTGDVVLEVVRRLRPRVVLTQHWEQRHPDHAAASRLAYEACFFAGLRNYDKELGPPWRPAKLAYALTMTPTADNRSIEANASVPFDSDSDGIPDRLDEDDDEDEVRIQQPRVEFHENDIEFHEVSYERHLWPLASSLIGKETLTMFHIRCRVSGKGDVDTEI